MPGAERLQGQRQLVVLGERVGVVDVAGNAGQHRSAGGGHRSQGVGTKQRRRAGQHEHPALASGDVASVAEVLVALQLSEESG